MKFSKKTPRKRILFVCMGNICRSPSAEGVARHYLTQRGMDGSIEVESAGTHDYHCGSPPDPRAVAAARRRGIDLSRQRARQVEVRDFECFDLVLAMDEANLSQLKKICPPQHLHKLALLMSYARRHSVQVVPDPYYGGAQGFEVVLDMLEDAVDGLMETLGRG